MIALGMLNDYNKLTRVQEMQQAVLHIVHCWLASKEMEDFAIKGHYRVMLLPEEYCKMKTYRRYMLEMLHDKVPNTLFAFDEFSAELMKGHGTWAGVTVRDRKTGRLVRMYEKVTDEVAEKLEAEGMEAA